MVNMEEIKTKGNYQKLITKDNDWIYIHKINNTYFIDILSDNTKEILISGGTSKHSIKVEVQ
jgi:hypothetical protein